MQIDLIYRNDTRCVLRKKDLRYNIDPKIFPPDPRKLDAVGQIIYVIKCLERGFSEEDIIGLYMDDMTAARIIIDLTKEAGLIIRDDKGKWKRTNKARRLIVGSGNKAQLR